MILSFLDVIWDEPFPGQWQEGVNGSRFTTIISISLPSDTLFRGQAALPYRGKALYGQSEQPVQTEGKVRRKNHGTLQKVGQCFVKKVRLKYLENHYFIYCNHFDFNFFK